ncbi:lipocalin family protein [Salinisphaera sp.]|uniref:lipocalin family protein n=1 Tax=Salinisphaera sp. TaxID=1914330 RepID=UPI002D7773E8|nr:lipocalin family protein [Salinisphaera sp.]HET7314432.1 lipocalin family protein [Salinisphaera sp.]
MARLRFLGPLCALMSLSACSVVPSPDFPREHNVDLDRYMGTWYVIANIPPAKTKHAYNAIERYTRGEGNRIDVEFTYREGGFDGEKHTMTPTGSVIDDTGNAVWAMHFYWVLRLQFVISYVSPDYDSTIVAREARDYVWIMARTPQISDEHYQALVQRVADLGYDTEKLRKVPQQPLAERDDL